MDNSYSSMFIIRLLITYIIFNLFKLDLYKSKLNYVRSNLSTLAHLSGLYKPMQTIFKFFLKFHFLESTI